MLKAGKLILALAVGGAAFVGGCKDDTNKSNTGAPAGAEPSGRPSATQPAEEPTTSPMPMPGTTQPTGAGSSGTEAK